MRPVRRETPEVIREIFCDFVAVLRTLWKGEIVLESLNQYLLFV